MILDLLYLRSIRNVDSSSGGAGPGLIGAAFVGLLLLILLPFAACQRGCTPKPTLAQIHTAAITQALGGAGIVTVALVAPPIGPWTLTANGSRYYRATVASNGASRTIWVEAYVHMGWTAAAVVLGPGDPVYGYRYSGETRVLGRTFYPSIGR